MRIVAFIQETPVIEHILHHIGELTEAPQVLPARAPPQHAQEFDECVDVDEWPDVDQTTGETTTSWNETLSNERVSMNATDVVSGTVHSRARRAEAQTRDGRDGSKKGGCFSYALGSRISP